MRKTLSLICLLVFAITVSKAKSKKPKFDRVGKVTYKIIYNGKEYKSRPTVVEYAANSVKISRSNSGMNLIPGTPEESTFIDFHNQKIVNLAEVKGGKLYNYETPFSKIKELKITEETEKIAGYECKKATVSLFSNRIDIWFTTKARIKGSPQPAVGMPEGLVLKVVRNGSFITVADKVEIKKNRKAKSLLPNEFGKTVDRVEYKKQLDASYVTTVNVFNDEQLCWGWKKENPEGDKLNEVYHYSGGTVIVKKVKLPELNYAHSIFAELKQYSNGDAYDRTGTIFIIPVDKKKSFLDGLKGGKDKLPIWESKNGKKYQGVLATEEYNPAIELIRFFTTFGVRHFNDRRKIMDWEDHSYFKKDVSEYKSLLKGEVYIGAFIGNYDKGGHKVSLDLKYYPSSQELYKETPKQPWIYPAFNTLNIMEMSGQNYGTMFLGDSLNVEVEIPKGVKNLKMIYTTTGHGGWGTGDEFVPKENSILINGEKVFAFTPWRKDCGTYRKYNPASGNFWNGVSSSDLSRSGWCPGTITNPVIINLSDLKPGKHKITVAIPLGKNEGGTSSWNVSGVLIGDME